MAVCNSIAVAGIAVTAAVAVEADVRNAVLVALAVAVGLDFVVFAAVPP